MPNFAPLISILFVTLLLFSYSAPAVAVLSWCLANAFTTSPEKLQANIDYACSKIDCAPIWPGGRCFLPDNVFSHACFAMNSYYQELGKTSEACDFDGTGFITVNDPSFGACQFLTII